MEHCPTIPTPYDVLDVLPQQPGEPVTAVMDRIRDALSTRPQVSTEATHYFADGLYARELVIPKDVMVVGKIHRTGHINILLQGVVDIMTSVGVERYVAPAVIVSKAGEQKIAHAIEEATWVTIHATTETDIDKIEQQLVTTDLAQRGLR
jgi:hypothetical protein